MRPEAVVPIAQTTRNGVVESVHYGAVVCLDAGGEVAWTAGDAATPIYPRSSLKPLQAEAMLAAGLRIDGAELAVACASHAGQPVHVAVVERLLAAHGLDAGALQNTASYPLDEPSAYDLVRAGTDVAPLFQNCSGKHAAMLATCVVNGWPLDSYLALEHPLQRAIDAYVARVTGGVVHTGIDGCGAPTAMVSLIGLARALRAVAGSGTASYRAMTAHPHLVAGDGREDTVLMRAIPGLVVKGGAEAVGVAALPDGRAVALKVSDGGDRARLPVLLAALASLGVDVAAAGVPVPAILGHGRPVGETIALVP